MQELVNKYNLERIDYLRNNKKEITSDILEDLRSYGIAGKQIAIDILELKEDERVSPVHLEEIQKCRDDVFYFKDNYLLILKASKPGKTAVSPSASSILKSWLYFAILSDLEAEPVLICPQF